VSPTICAGAGQGGNNLPLAVEQEVVGTLCARDGKGADNIYAEQNKLVVESSLLIRRLIPLECELLQGLPPGWTDIPGASDTARYKALGNSIAIPCAEFVLGGIVKYVDLEI
jgi:DNA (cytosine-5)-methyltransferase 1